NPNTNGAIMAMMKDQWFPFITEQMRAKYKWETFYYGNVSDPSRGGGAGRGRGGDAGAAGGRQAGPPAQPPAGAGSQLAAPQGQPGQRAWATFEHVPRFHNNYVGMRNRFALLSEAYAYATFEDRIKATNYFV